MTVRSALILLDQTVGDLRIDGDQVSGIDLWPTTEDAFAKTAESAGLAGSTVEISVLAHGPVEAPQVTADLVQDVDVLLANPESISLLELAGERSPHEVALVTTDRRLRGHAASAGMRPVPHVALLPLVVADQSLSVVLITGSRDAVLLATRSGTAVPMSFQPKGDMWALIAVVDTDVVQAAVAGAVEMTMLACDALIHDLAWVRPGDPLGSDVSELLGTATVLHVEADQLLIALGPDDDIDDFHLHGAHGHTEYLGLDPYLLDRPAARDVDNELHDLAMLSASAIGGLPVLERVPKIVLDPQILKKVRPSCDSVTATYESDLDRYTGVTALDGAGPIASRHIGHSDNKRVEAQLIRDLRTMGYCPWRHNFTHAGQTHSNIVADLPGRGIWRLPRPVLDRYRKVLTQGPWHPRHQFDGASLADLLDPDYFGADPLVIDDRELRRRIEAVLRLRPWYPWWKYHCPIAGFGADLILVGCHLDSTAGFESGYDAANDPAPGRDDNGSGIAGVLSVARYFAGLKGQLTHTVRFCFFNAEEQGLVGSKAYAAKLKATQAPVRSVVCMDMMGHNSDANRFFELHAGYTDATVRDASVPLATAVASAAAAQGRLGPAQIYQGTSANSGSPDRMVYDGAINRSDHAAFQQQGYPAVLVSEDFFANLASEPSSDPNPNYHRSSDTVVDIAYARDIVCAVNQAVIDLAR